MTTQDKNKCISEMLSWVYVKDGDIWNPNMLHDYSFTRTTDLKFDTDANWQLEALKFITETYDAAWKLTSKFCQIHNHDNGFDCRCEINCPENPLIDMFECLFQFSQYLKTIK